MVSCWHLAVQYRGTKTLLLFSIVLTTCHLINLMPFTVLNQKFLFSLLFPNCSPFPLLIHLFVIFLVLDPSQDKLSIRPHKFSLCILVKGYQYFSLESHNYFRSDDITFSKSTFFSLPHQNLSSNRISLLCICIVTIQETIFISKIMFSTKLPNISRLIVTLFKIY